MYARRSTSVPRRSVHEEGRSARRPLDRNGSHPSRCGLLIHRGAGGEQEEKTVKLLGGSGEAWKGRRVAGVRRDHCGRNVGLISGSLAVGNRLSLSLRLFSQFYWWALGERRSYVAVRCSGDGRATLAPISRGRKATRSAGVVDRGRHGGRPSFPIRTRLPQICSRDR